MTSEELFEKFLKRDEDRFSKYNESPQHVEDTIVVLDGRIRDIVSLIHYLYKKESEREEKE